MANYKISTLTAYPNSTFGDTDKFEVSYYSGGIHYSRYLTGAQLKATIPSGITVGTTPITSGTTRRVFFQDGTVVSQSANFVFDASNQLVIGGHTGGAKLDVKAGGALSTDIAFRVRNSADTGNIIDARGNSTINFFPAVSNPVLNINSNINPTVNLYDGNGLVGVIAHRYQNNPANASNLISQSVNIASYGVGGGTLGGAKINHFINTYNWGNTYDAQKEGGYSLYFDATNNFEGVVNSKKALWISPDKRQFIYNKTGDVITAQTDAFCFYADDQTAGNSAPHFKTENGSIIKLFKGAVLTTADATLATAITRIAELEARLQANGLLA